MKNIALYVTILLPLLSVSQYTQKDVFQTEKITFYGYDFTHFKFIEQKREGQGQQLKTVIFEIIDICANSRIENIYRKRLDKDTILFDYATVTKLNTQIKPENIMGFMRNVIPRDSLQSIINNYDTKGKSGIGFVQVIECLYKPKKEALIWFVFFDISTKQVLYAIENSNNDADSYHGLGTYWAVGINCSFQQFGDKYRKIKKKELKND